MITPKFLFFLIIIIFAGCSSQNKILKEAARLNQSMPEEWKSQPAIILKKQSTYQHQFDARLQPSVFIEKTLMVQFNRAVHFTRPLDIPFSAQIRNLSARVIRNNTSLDMSDEIIRNETVHLEGKSSPVIPRYRLDFSAQAGDVLIFRSRVKIDYIPVNIVWQIDDELPTAESSLFIELPNDFPSILGKVTREGYKGESYKMYTTYATSYPTEQYFAQGDPFYLKFMDLQRSEFSFHFVNEDSRQPEINRFNPSERMGDEIAEVSWVFKNLPAKNQNLFGGKYVLIAQKKMKSWKIFGEALAEIYFGDCPQKAIDEIASQLPLKRADATLLLQDLRKYLKQKMPLIDVPLRFETLKPVRIDHKTPLEYLRPNDFVYLAACLLQSRGFNPVIGITCSADLPAIDKYFRGYQGNRMLIGVKEEAGIHWFDPVLGELTPELWQKKFHEKEVIFAVFPQGKSEFVKRTGK